MLQRVSIMIDENIARKVRNKQGKLIQKSRKSVSFSGVINQCLAECLKKEKI